MNTKIFSISNNNKYLQLSVDMLRSGEAIAFPTETVYGLGADIYNLDACKKVFEIKNRSFDKPLAAHISNLNMAEEVAILDERFYKLADAFLPGPLAIIVPKKACIDDLITSNLKTISIRFPDDFNAIKLIEEFGHPLAATSANISGGISPVDGKSVMEQLNGKVAAIINEGSTKYQGESTIITLAESKPKILRKGAIDEMEVLACLNK